MKKYDINSMLEAWSSGSSLSSNDPFPAPTTDGEEVDDLINQGAADLTTNVTAPDGHDINKALHAKSFKVTEAELPPEEEEMPPEQDPTMMQDPSMGGGAMPPPGSDPNAMANQDPSMMGMPPLVGPTSTFDVGRVYELKKIYSRLVSMQSYLAGTTDPNLIKLRNYVAGTMDLFRTLISNVTLYKDRLDEIIIVFYKVVDNVYSILSKYYKDKDSGKMVQAIEHTIFVRKRSKK
jgi:hypothetical protein